MKDIPYDPRDAAAYTLAESARYLRLPVATLRSWVVGRDYDRVGTGGRSEPIIEPSSPEPLTLSFWNLIEGHVLRSLRTDHGVSLRAVRAALSYAQTSLSIPRPLLSRELCTDAGRVFLDRYGQLIELSASGQLAMRKVFEEHLQRVEWDKLQFPVRLFPFLPSPSGDPARPIVIDPAIAFGRPILSSRGISTLAIVERIDAGESVQDIASDYDLTTEEIEKAVLYERAA